MDRIDYRLAFDLAPVGLALSRQRTMVDCNQALCEMFGASREQLVGQSFRILYPSADEYERTGARIEPIIKRGASTYADERIMQRVDGRFKGEHRFVGLFTSNAYNLSPREIPLLRKKCAAVTSRRRAAFRIHKGHRPSHDSGAVYDVERRAAPRRYHRAPFASTAPDAGNAAPRASCP